MYKQLFLFLSFYLFCLNIFAQITPEDPKLKKTYRAERINKAPKIDGVLNDDAYNFASNASNFVMLDPGDGTPIPQDFATSVKIIYDDEAIYIGATMLSADPSKTISQFTQRDNLEQSEFFLIDINPYNDGENQTRFIVTAAGTQADAKMTGNNEDYNYNVVWESAISKDEDGWYAEIKIPYSALRFPKKDVQLWSIQLFRKISHLNQTYVWSYINKSLGKNSQYNGLLTGLKNIDPPVRLSFYPYTSAEVDNYDGNTQSNFSAGLDIKYGISDAFTLDATLIPDFGQTAYDNVELNLGPFEQTFGENRAFFTEGTELFSKGNLFYSRRIGDTPVGFNSAQKDRLENEVIIDNPERTDLLNALKISGRTDNNLGVGFFNAITKTTYSVYKDTITGKFREQVTEPLSNYNIFVLDQQFNQNSSITLINTNVTRDGHFRDGNVSGFLFDIFNKANSYNFTGQAKMSNVNLSTQNITGFASELGVSRTKGKVRFDLNYEFANETYDINDLGLNFINNYNNFYWNASYRIFEPTKFFNDMRIEFFGKHERRYKPNVTLSTGIASSFFAVTKERFAFGGAVYLNTDERDYFEPRKEGAYVIYNKNYSVNAWISSDYRKKFALDVRAEYQDYANSKQDEFSLKVSPRFRFNDKFSIIYSFNYNATNNRDSFVERLPRQIVFGNRDNKSIENSLQGSYNFSTKQALNLSFRNFWSVANYTPNAFTNLQDDGKLNPTSYNVTEDNDPNVNFNIWNLDLSYRWQFAPGSEAVLLYRNAIFNIDSNSELEYVRSLENLFSSPIRQNLSLKIVYYLDYNNIKSIFKS